MGPFKKYDIRGKYPEEVSPEFSYKLGRAFAHWSKAKTIVVGKDCRIGSGVLHDELVRGIRDQGAEVLDIGLCSTPVLYYASFKYPAIMVTASHLPQEYNGFKLCMKGAIAIGEETGLKDIKKLMNEDLPYAKEQGKISGWGVMEDYAQHVQSFAKKLKPLKAVVDAANGMAGVVAPYVFKGLPVEILELYFEPDGSFPNHEPNPLLPESTKALSREVRKQKADLGVAYDADCDRVFFIDEKGNRIGSDATFLILARNVKKEDKIVATVNLTRQIEKAVPAQVIRSPVGHTVIKQTMRNAGAVFGGEMSGHYYFKKNKYADSGDIAAICMLQALSDADKPISELAKEHATAKSDELNVKQESPEKAMKLLEQAFHDAKQEKIDGITFIYDTWWFNARPSHTEPVLRINIEATTRHELQHRIAQVFEALGLGAP